MTFQSKLILGTFLVAICVASCGNACFASHPYHVSSAEINWNPKTGNFEVALCVWPADLETALARQQSQSIDLDNVDDLDGLMEQYVVSRFMIQRVGAATGSKNGFRWVGHEINLRKAWLYFEIAGDTTSGQWQVENRLFFESNEDQINQVQLQVDGNPRSIPLSVQKSKLEFTTKCESKIKAAPSH